MNVYRINYDDYYQAWLEAYAGEFLLNSGTIRQLLKRYDLDHKKVLSVGPGVGIEEYWLYKQGGCALTFVDRDEHRSIEPYLRALPPAGSNERALTYFVGDAGN